MSINPCLPRGIQRLVKRTNTTYNVSCCCENPKQPIKVHVGTDRFDKLVVESDVFVDKSMFIKEFLESGDEVSLITRPRRWCKSLNMDMLRCFLTIEVDDQGKPLPPEQTRNHKLFAGGVVTLGAKTGKVKQLAPLRIAQQCPDLINDYQGQYPVISMGFKDVTGNSYREIEAKVKKQITKLYTKHTYLKQYMQAGSTLLAEVQKEQLSHYYTGNLSQADVEDSLLFLSELLHMHYGRNVYILIDEYDMPISSTYLACLDKPAENEKISVLLSGLLGSALKSNPYLQQGLVTGVLQIAKSGPFSGLNNVRSYTLLHKDFADSYGFTESEVSELLNKTRITTPLKKIQSWYNGYTFGGQSLYNPWSVMSCIRNEGALEYYWMELGGPKIFDAMMASDEIQEDLQALLKGAKLSPQIIKHLSFDNMRGSGNAGLYSLLLFHGYLAPSDIEADTCKLSIPNQEMKHIYGQWLIKWVSNQMGITPYEFKALADLLVTGQVENFTESLQGMLHVSNSPFLTDKSEDKP